MTTAVVHSLLTRGVGTWSHVLTADGAALLVDVPRDVAGKVWVGCASGYRAALAAGILRDAGYDVRALTRGGLQDVTVDG